jgi:hypothetical protein
LLAGCREIRVLLGDGTETYSLMEEIGQMLAPA